MQSCFNVTIQDDPFIEGTESFELILSQEDVDEDVAFVDNSATVMILDSDGKREDLAQFGNSKLEIPHELFNYQSIITSMVGIPKALK